MSGFLELTENVSEMDAQTSGVTPATTPTVDHTKHKSPGILYYPHATVLSMLKLQINNFILKSKWITSNFLDLKFQCCPSSK